MGTLTWFKISKKLIILILLGITMQFFGQDAGIKFTQYSTADGLSQSSVQTIYQDENGFLWLGTYGGFNRFDGFNFKVFLNDKSNPYSLSDNRIRSICKDTTGVLFLGTRGGLNRFFIDEEIFVDYTHNPADPNSLANNTVFKIFKDSDGDVWIGTWGGGLDKLETIDDSTQAEKDRKYRFIHHIPEKDKNSISALKISDITQTPDGLIWIATRHGLDSYDKNTKRFTNYHSDSSDITSLSHDNVSALCVDKQGNIWAGTWGGGLNLFDQKTGKFKRFFYNENDPYSISGNIVKALFCDKDGTVWVGTWGAGLNKIIPPGEPLSAFKPEDVADEYRFLKSLNNENDKSSISGNSVYSIYEDRTGMIWVGIDWGGVNKFENRPPKFQHIYSEDGKENSLISNIVYTMIFDSAGKLWIGTQRGVQVYDPQTKQYKLHQYDEFDKNTISNNIVLSAIEDHAGNIWLGTMVGFNKYNPKTGMFTRYYEDISNPDATHALCLAEDSFGNIWVGNYGEGLFRFNPETEKFDVFSFNENNSKTISDNIIWSILEDKNKNLWLGTSNGGLSMFDPQNGEFTRYLNNPDDSTSISDNYVLSLYIDSRNDFWIGTSGGLNKKYIDDSGKVCFYHNFPGLLKNSLCSGIIEDDLGNLWISGSLGLFNYNIEKNEVVSYGLDDGLQDVEFSVNAFEKDENSGTIYVGGINGYNVFNPEHIKGNDIKPQTKIVELKIFNRPVKAGQEVNGRIIIDKAIHSVETIVLTHKEYVFSLEFAATHYQSPKGNKYAYKLDGFETKWNYVGDQRAANYTNLAPGKYTFLVKASNSDGLWNEEPTSLRIIIKPPWWKTIVFKISALILIVLIIFVLYRIRIRELNETQKVLEQMVIERTEDLQEINVVLEEKQEEISIQNEELQRHRSELEKLVDERTEELQRAKVKAEESDRLKSSFLANMSHEVRTPMNAIIGFSNLLDDPDVDNNERSYYIGMIQNNGNALLTLINDILDISTIEANQLVLYKDHFCLDDIFKEIYSYFTLKNDKNIELIYENSGENEKTFLFTDSVRFRQVMNNLITNAVKYTDEGYVRFGFKTNTDDIFIYVEDTGIGIEESNQSQIFNYFHKVESDGKKLYQGSGIGLSISQKLVQMMDSCLMVESKPGKGSKFSFTLSKSNYSNPNNSGKASIKKVYNFSDKTILIAEDEKTNFELIKLLLRKTGARLIWAPNGLEAVEIIKGKEEKINLILMDIKMPVMGGYEAFDQIHKLSPDIPVVAITAYAQAGDKSKIIKYGFTNYISKPVNADLLMELIYQCSK
ncbi:MAG: response regulator [Bacteroidales bacterium]|nr:response regulator [Bacteroidales bacterium]MBN2817498.1 response regulator [Bacteroidales bacterium]